MCIVCPCWYKWILMWNFLSILDSFSNSNWHTASTVTIQIFRPNSSVHFCPRKIFFVRVLTAKVSLITASVCDSVNNGCVEHFSSIYPLISLPLSFSVNDLYTLFSTYFFLFIWDSSKIFSNFICKIRFTSILVTL